ncbi:neutral zinc metallopeptidase [Breoghania sp. L-A4]|uniref:KPN_02809 family neutral zinc metallopeptidase n=1 Tax=Breoghania sp. L-A4 TaxID=2304600 RepID=UPI000E35C031|nr:neutral zinc metallopeptidase [Breoghania sp. L-A4]AXS42109.1 flagellar biosynthesis protein FlgM [Breoghania sp. L-A4]
MRWKGRRQSGNVQDVRGQSGSRSRGAGFRLPIGRGSRRGARGLGLGGILVLVALYAGMTALGIDPAVLFGDGAPQTSSGARQTPARNDEAKRFVSTVLAETEDVWHALFGKDGERYVEPVLVLFSGQVRSGCGLASSSTGPFYCPADSKVYIDLTFYDQLERGLNAGGDFAQAYVLAHEVGHHVQNLIGVLPRFHEARRSLSAVEANRMSVRVELQADCFAGIWAGHTDKKGLLEEGDIAEALNAARQIGDDALQRRSQGYVEPESFNHGTSQQRAAWFRRGLESGEPAACDTFSAQL